MFDKVVVGVDGRSGGRDAIALAGYLAAAPSGIVLAHVDVLVVGSVGRRLCERAERERADLLVVGSSRRGGIGRVLLGDDTLVVLEAARCAVAVAPRGYASTRSRWQTIGVGHDGTAESDLALGAARELARRHGASIRVLRAVPLQSVHAVHGEPLDWTDATEGAIRAERKRLESIPGVRAEVVYGEPAQELENLAGDAQLLIVGSRGRGPLDRLFTGSVSTRLVRHSRCPVLVMPRRLTQTVRGVFAGPSRDPLAPAAPMS